MEMQREQLVGGNADLLIISDVFCAKFSRFTTIRVVRTEYILSVHYTSHAIISIGSSRQELKARGTDTEDLSARIQAAPLGDGVREFIHTVGVGRAEAVQPNRHTRLVISSQASPFSTASHVPHTTL
jgi:hypothetical protein